jgi:hypothetical protein
LFGVALIRSQAHENLQGDFTDCGYQRATLRSPSSVVSADNFFHRMGSIAENGQGARGRISRRTSALRLAVRRYAYNGIEMPAKQVGLF